MLSLLLAAPALAAPLDDRFPLGADRHLTSYAALVERGVAVGRTGRVLAATASPEVLRVHPEVASVVPLGGGLYRVVPAPGADDLALARALDRLAGVDWAEPDLLLPLRLHAPPDDPLLVDEWHLENTGQGGRTADVDIDAELAWQFATGVGQRIAILDSGVQLDHPDLVVTGGHDYVDADDDVTPPADDWQSPHGTACAGVAAGRGDNAYGVAGVAWDADLYAIRLIGGETSTEDLYDAFVEAVDAGATVLSNSWGWGDSCTEVPEYRVFGQMFRYAEDHGRGGLGSVVVFAAGNANCDVAGDAMLNHELPVVVAAIEASDRRAGYSSYGDAVDVAAPTGLLTTDMFPGGYGAYQDDDAFADGFGGTSAATPVVAGVYALLFEANPRLTAAQAREVVCQTAVRVDAITHPYDEAGRNPWYGCGRVDAGAAVAAVANAAPGAPVPTSPTDQAPGTLELTWAAAEDPDADDLAYVVRLQLEGEEAVEVEVPGTSLWLGGWTEGAGTLTWSVRAEDVWGEGPESAAVTVNLTPRTAEEEEPPEREPPPAEGCATGGGTLPGSALVAAAAAALIRRRPQ